jgi:hypothetical protein
MIYFITSDYFNLFTCEYICNVAAFVFVWTGPHIRGPASSDAKRNC